MSDDNFLSRWSRRKIAVRTGRELEEPVEAKPVVPVETGTQPTLAVGHDVPTTGVVPESSGTQLPPIESLTPESDFTAFMKPDVDPGLRRQALKVLLRDPRFNVMDGLDTYIDDYSKPDPIPEEWFSQLYQMKRLGAYVEPEEAAEKEENSAETDPETLQKPIPEQALPAVDESAASDTADGGTVNVSVTESGTAGVKLPRNEA